MSTDLKQANPHEPSLTKFLRGREQHVTTGYLRNEKTGQIRKDTVTDTLERWQHEKQAEADAATDRRVIEAGRRHLRSSTLPRIRTQEAP